MFAVAPPASMATSPLALAAYAFWNGQNAVQLALALDLPSDAVEAIEGLRDLAGHAPAKVRARCATRLRSLETDLADYVQERNL